MMVRQYEETRRSHFVIGLSTSPADYRDDAEFELAISAAGSLGLRALRDSHRVEVRVQERALPVRHGQAVPRLALGARPLAAARGRRRRPRRRGGGDPSARERRRARVRQQGRRRTTCAAACSRLPYGARVLAVVASPGEAIAVAAPHRRGGRRHARRARAAARRAAEGPRMTAPVTPPVARGIRPGHACRRTARPAPRAARESLPLRRWILDLGAVTLLLARPDRRVLADLRRRALSGRGPRRARARHGARASWARWLPVGHPAPHGRHRARLLPVRRRSRAAAHHGRRRRADARDAAPARPRHRSRRGSSCSPRSRRSATDDGHLIVPFLLALVAAVLTTSLALRLRSAAWALIPAAGVPRDRDRAGHVASRSCRSSRASCSRWSRWSGWRCARPGSRRRRPISVGEGAASAGAGVRRVLSGAAVVAIAAVVGIATSGFAAPTSPRYVLRDVVIPPFDIREYASPLQSFRAYVRDYPDDAALHGRGLPEGARVRLATMDAYNGTVYNVSDEGSRLVERVRRRSRTNMSADAEGTEATVHVEIGALESVWMPEVGAVPQRRRSTATGPTTCDAPRTTTRRPQTARRDGRPREGRRLHARRGDPRGPERRAARRRRRSRR